MNEILIYIGIFILVLNLVLFIKIFANQGKAYKIFTWYLGIIFCVQLVSNVMMQFNINNLFLSHFYFIGQFVVLSLFYLIILENSLQKKIVKTGLIIVFLVLAIQYVVDSSLFFKYNLLEIFSTSFLLIIYAVFHFYNMLNGKKEFYYINMGILLYLFGSTILFLVGNLTTLLSKEMSLITWILNSLLYIVYQLFILVEWKKSFFKKEFNKTIEN
jgi:hypothetical protein